MPINNIDDATRPCCCCLINCHDATIVLSAVSWLHQFSDECQFQPAVISYTKYPCSSQVASSSLDSAMSSGISQTVEVHFIQGDS